VEKVQKLNEAFHDFTRASKSLETYYDKLNKRVQYLTQELENKNAQLNSAILDVKESKDYLQGVLQSIEEAMIVVDQDERITMINKGTEILLGVRSEHVKGTLLNDLEITIDTGSSGTQLTSGDRKYDVIVSRSKVSDADGLIRGYVILIKDITVLKELERQNERNQRLISMGEMAAKIVHEIRSPLCSIELFSTMLSNDLKGTEHSEMAHGISTGISSLNNILTNMLLFAKSQKPSLKDVNPSSAVKESLEMLRPLIEVRGLKLTQDLNDETVSGDAELLKQVFMNILLNAIQSMPDGGNLKVLMGICDEYITVSIIDEGSGITEENIEKIFDPFFSTKEKGTGLGLAIAHKIMQCHNGLIKAYKNEERGSTFCINFPKINKEANNTNNKILITKSE
jgi:signal transduction histidine kinase